MERKQKKRKPREKCKAVIKDKRRCPRPAMIGGYCLHHFWKLRNGEEIELIDGRKRIKK